MNVFRAVLITGAPGIGKTTSAHLCAKLQGFNVIELNASDSRSKSLVEVISLLVCSSKFDYAHFAKQSSLNISNTSLDGWMGKGEAVRLTSDFRNCDN